MSGIIDICVTTVNVAGRAFCDYAAGMFVQIAVLVAVLLCIDWLSRKRIRATLRYWIWMLVFVKLLLPPSLCVPTGLGYWLGRGEALPAPSVVPQIVEVAKLPAPTSVELPLAAPVVRAAESVPTGSEPKEQVARSHVSLTWQGGAALLWIAGVLVFAGLVVQRWRFVKELIARSEPAAADQIDLLDQCRRRMNVRGPVSLRLLPDACSPAVCGLLRPTILAPRALLDRLPPEGLKAVLIHELAHVRRGDLWANSLQTALQVVYFYNPLVWLASAIVRRVREQAVDEMVLVALGAEARSYGNTLIDIAEMAFLRPSPALRLIGVAESRKSLEGRIKHMMTRPIPKSARVGILGVFVVTAVGAILLPMAQAAVEPQPRFIANLAGGATVELLGVCNWPVSGPIAWRADGSSLDKPLYAHKWNVHPGVNDYGLLFRVAGNDDIDLMWDRIEGGEGSEGSCDVVDDQGNPLEGGNAAVASIKPSTAQTTLRVGLPTGPWTTISSHDGKKMGHGRGRGMLWSQAFPDSSGTRIVASMESRTMRKHRIAAIDTEGTMHIAPGAGSVSFGSVHQFTAHFPDLAADRIKEFLYQVRECQMIEFQDVSLRPGQKTEVRIEVEKLGALSTVATVSQPPATVSASGGRPNVFMMAPSRTDFNVFNAAIARADAWARNRTGRYHSKQSYDEIFDGTHNRTDHDVLVLVFSLDSGDRIPGGYEDLLPKPWPQIEDQLRRGETVELSGQARGLTVILLAAPNTARLKQVIAESRFLQNPSASAHSSGTSVFQGYPVNRSVADFPAGEDLSTPEAAYATINRMDTGDPDAWRGVSVVRLAARMAGDRKRTVDPEWPKVLSNARIREVVVWNMSKAAVIAELPQDVSSKKIGDPFDVRYLELENGRWLNTGNDRFASIEAAKTKFMSWMKRETSEADAMRDPLAHADEIQAAAGQLFDKLRAADYAKILSYYRDGKWANDGWKQFPTLGLYTVHTDYPSFALWCATHFKDNPIASVQLGDVFISDALVADKTGRPTVPYKVTLKDGSVLAGNLPFYLSQGKWIGLEGIDWHLRPNETR